MARIWLYLWLALIGVAVVGVPVVMLLDPPTAGLARLRVGELQPRAEAACRCARAARNRGAKAACWDRFGAATGVSLGPASGTACFPLSQRGVWLADGSQLTLSYSMVVGGNGGDEFCTRAEAMQAEALFFREYQATDQSEVDSAAINRGLAAMRRFSRQLIERRILVSGEQSQGCVGSAP
ncbi:hypothetical protein [Sphingomonas sp.]|uniref:hypothetical protein n=1 Tax=Sphingomonas sp. TaxID=28214 RepID=UPI001B0766D0|nr:hypothetical protein [Sphingomonas sp.]MBO9714980.1 hypothetical protein [Sphingomonas sp.]